MFIDRNMNKLKVLVLQIVFISFLLGCSDGNNDNLYRISGTVKKQTNGILAPSKDVIVDVTKNGSLVATTKTGSNGGYELVVESGAYTLYFKQPDKVNLSVLESNSSEPAHKRRLNTNAGVTTADVAFSSSSESLRVIEEPEDGQKPIVDLINSATDNIKISIYTIVDTSYQMDTDILNALADASADGVAVQFIFNDFNHTEWPKSGKKYLEYEEKFATDNQMDYQVSSSAFTYTHNKYMIIDGCTAVIMTGNLNYGSFPPGGYTKNFYVVDTYSAHVDYLSDLFSYDVKNGKNGTDYTPHDIPSDLLVNPNDGYSAQCIASLIDQTAQTLDIYMMYFDGTCPQAIFDAINTAADGDVKIRIIASNLQESSVVNEKLSEAVASGNFQMVIEPSQNSAQLPFIHTKTYISDGENVLLGSMNMSDTSLMKNRELDLETQDTTLTAQIQNDFDTDWNVFYHNEACTFIPPKGN